MTNDQFYLRLKSAAFSAIAFFILALYVVAIDFPFVAGFMTLSSPLFWMINDQFGNGKNHYLYCLAGSAPSGIVGFIIGFIWPLQIANIKQIIKPILIRFSIYLVILIVGCIVLIVMSGPFQDS